MRSIVPASIPLPEPPTMLSRVANSLYWLARYVERADNLARLLGVSQQLILDTPEDRRISRQRYGQAVLRATGVDGDLLENGDLDTWFGAARYLALDTANPDSIRQCIAHARENARVVRDQLSETIWKELNRLHLFLKSSEAEARLREDPEELYEEIISRSMLLQGLIDNTLSRREGWEFLRLGRFLERADKTSRIIDIRLYLEAPNPTPSLESHYWTAVLRSCSARTAYRIEHGGMIGTENVINLLVFSKVFARSIRFSLLQADEALHAISGVPRGEFSNEPERILGTLLGELNFCAPETWLSTGLHESVDRVQSILNEVGQGVFETFVLNPSLLNEVAPLVPSWTKVQMQLQQQQQ